MFLLELQFFSFQNSSKDRNCEKYDDLKTKFSVYNSIRIMKLHENFFYLMVYRKKCFIERRNIF